MWGRGLVTFVAVHAVVHDTRPLKVEHVPMDYRSLSNTMYAN